jgi:predicted dehydrogenase
VYLDSFKRGNAGWPVSVLVDGLPDIENVTAALKTGPYGQCVYESPNDVVDHQVVNIEFSSGATVSFTMVAFTEQICDRQSRLHFSHGELIGDMSSFVVNDFRAEKRSVRHHPLSEGGGHGGGDMGLVRSFVEAVRTRNQSVLGVTVQEALDSHLAVFAAEAARKERRVVEFSQFVEEMRKKHGQFEPGAYK